MSGRVSSALVLAAFVVSGCAGRLQTSAASTPITDGQRGWLALRDGQPKLADEAFARALASTASDPRALFGAVNLAYERGDDEAALRHAVALLDVASKGDDGIALALSAAVLARMSRLLSEVAEPGPAEARLIAFDPTKLPWQARYGLALILFDIARKRGDASLFGRAVEQAGCVDNLAMVGRGGRLPYLDFSDDGVVADPVPQPLVRAGCEFQLNTAEARAGIRVLRSEISLPEGQHQLILDYSGPARMRIDHGDWYRHGGSVDTYGPRWSAHAVQVASGRHTIEVRIGAYGATADLALLVLPASPGRELFGEGSAGDDQTMMAFASLLLANLVGDVDGMLRHIGKLEAQPHFAIGLAAAARLGEVDPTRPDDIMRDKARDMFSRALAADPQFARPWLDLSNLEMQKNRPREAVADARKAIAAAPRWWPARLGLAAALRAQGFDQPADRALDAGVRLLDGATGGCSLLEQALDRAEERNNESAAANLVERIAGCDAQSDSPRLWLAKHGDLAGVRDWFARSLPLSPRPLWLRSERADVLVALGDLKTARDELSALAQLAPRDVSVRLRLADALSATGLAEQAKSVLQEALARFPARSDVRQAVRLAGLPSPLDEFRLDGKAVIRDFLASGRTYQAPAVVVLDRAVEKVLTDGSRILLTHSITQVLSKEAVEQVGEVPVPDGAEILALRTHKADGTVREAEEIAGKSTISVQNLAVGDLLESETVEFKDPRDAIAPGFIGERFFFRSFDAPLDRSEYLLVAPASMRLDVDNRAGAPAPLESRAEDGSKILAFAAHQVPQAFPERSAVSPQEWIPSVRVSSAVSILNWSRFIADGFLRASRGSPQIRAAAAQIASAAAGDRSRLPEVLVAWVREHIEPETDLAESATSTLARGRGNRTALILALARTLDVRADLVLARSLLAANPESPIRADDLDDFRDVLVRFLGAGGARFVDPQIRRAPFAYLPPALSGAKAVVAGEAQVVTTASGVKDGRAIALRAKLDKDGAANVSVVEKVVGWPAVEWHELVDSTGKDGAKLRQEFEQRWLGQYFPGAQLDTLSVEQGETGTKVSYGFRWSGMASLEGHVLHLRPSFFQSQPGRRYGTEPVRKTTLLLGFDVPVDLDAEITLPPGTKVIDLGKSGEIKVGSAFFLESRTTESTPDGSIKLTLRRQSRLPLTRVEPANYAEVASRLRAVDPVEQSEIRIAVGGN